MTDSKRNEEAVDVDNSRQFKAPNMLKTKRGRLENTSTNSIQHHREIVKLLQQSYIDRKSIDHFVYDQPKFVHNATLINEFREKRKVMSQDRSEKELLDTIGFLAAKSEVEMRKYCSDGVKVANSSLTRLGNPTMGVYLCKHADLLQPSPFMDGQSGFIVMFKIIKGKAKVMVVNNRVGESFEPTPGFDCHLFKNVKINLASVSLKEAYETTQLYIYEYTEDLDVRERPRQVIPYAVVPFRYVTVDSPRQKSGATVGACSPNELCSIRPNVERLSLPLKRKRTLMPRMDFGGSAPVIGASKTAEGEIVWTGQLCLYSTTVSDVEMVSFSTFDLPWLLDPCLNLDHSQVGYDEIMTYYQLELLSSSPREQECRLCGKYFNYCALQPKSKESRNFLHVVNTLSTSKLGSRITLVENVDLIIVPHCRITYRLGLSSRFSDLPLLHCIFISASSYDRDAASNCRPLHLANNEIPVGVQLFESGSHHADVGNKVSFQERVVSSHSVKQSAHSAQSRVNLLDERVLTFTQPTVNSFCPFSDKSDNAQSGQSGAFLLNASASLDNPFSMSKLRHKRKLIQERGLSFDRVSAVFSDDLVKPNVVKPNLPVSVSFSSSLIESSTNDNQLLLHNVLSKQRDSSQECNKRTQTEMGVGENVQDDTNANTEYSPLLHRVSLRLGSSSTRDNEEHRQGIKKSCPSVLVLSSERIETMHEAKPAEMDKAHLSDIIADESIRMKSLLSKGGGETIDRVSMIQHSSNDAITISAASTLHEKEILLRMVDLLDEGLQPNQLDRLETLVLVPDKRKKDEVVDRTECTPVMVPSNKPIDVPVDNLNVPKEAPLQPKQNTEIPELDKAATSTNTEMSSSFRGSYDEKIVTDCVFTVLHRKWVGCFAKRKFERFQSDEDEVQMEIIWTYGLHFLPFYLGSDDDDFREVNVLDAKGPSHLKPQILKSREVKTVFNQDLYRDGSHGTPTEQSRPSYSKNRDYDCKDNSYQSQLRDYRFRDDRFHPYSRRCQLEKKEFYKVYREHRDFAELLQHLTSCNFKSRCNRPVQACFNPVSPATSARFEGCVFRRSTMDDADFILGQREKVDDCIEDIIFDKDQIPDFDAKKVIAEALDKMIRPFSASTSAARCHAPKKSQPSQETAGLCQTSDFPKSSFDKSGKSA